MAPCCNVLLQCLWRNDLLFVHEEICSFDQPFVNFLQTVFGTMSHFATGLLFLEINCGETGNFSLFALSSGANAKPGSKSFAEGVSAPSPRVNCASAHARTETILLFFHCHIGVFLAGAEVCFHATQSFCHCIALASNVQRVGSLACTLLRVVVSKQFHCLLSCHKECSCGRCAP